jgi:hypothetical protein
MIQGIRAFVADTENLYQENNIYIILIMMIIIQGIRAFVADTEKLEQAIRNKFMD